MTIKEAILQSLSDIKSLTISNQVCKHLIKNNYYDFGDAKLHQLKFQPIKILNIHLIVFNYSKMVLSH